ncbi:MAG: DUF1345 domain-containing protein [Proteobacteria bacterium]|nr:DUF1345 domain-containing protein [Pseudomonadota bacterium]
MRTVARVVMARPRLLAGVLAGAAAHAALPRGLAGVTRTVVAWDVGVTVFLVLSGWLFAQERISRMPDDAARQEEGEWTIFALTVAAIVFSFAAIFGEFALLKDAKPEEKTLRIALVAFTLFASWLMTHTTFAFRYAHEYYARSGGREVDGGLDFPGGKLPDYLDFMYFSLVLGMTFQVSDVGITSRKMRRLATLHGLLGFLFNTIIIALTVNIAAGML